MYTFIDKVLKGLGFNPNKIEGAKLSQYGSLLTGYDGVSLLSKKSTGKGQSWIKMDEIRYFFIFKPFFICYNIEYQKGPTSMLSVDETALKTKVSSF